VDGPILEEKNKSGIGMFPLPMSHGLTVAEFAQMANGQGWLTNKVKCPLKIIPVANYDHSKYYVLPVPPSPNLNTQQAIMLYPSTCMFEAVYVNHGRGTYYPFTVIGAPYLKGKYEFSFTPTGIKGMAETPIFMDQVCYGLDLRNYDIQKLRKAKKINLDWIMELYKASPDKENFFNTKLSNQMNRIEIQIGTSAFRQQIIDGIPESAIRKSWEPGLSQYKVMRKKYLIYKD
jgi:uncharacterized protein YbbC (DUF1343 family)